MSLVVPCTNIASESGWLVSMGNDKIKSVMSQGSIFSGKKRQALKCGPEDYLVYKHGSKKNKPYYGTSLHIPVKKRVIDQRIFRKHRDDRNERGKLMKMKFKKRVVRTLPSGQRFYVK